MSPSVELGMHRRRDVAHANCSYAEEIRKRIWWTVYNLDRHYAFTLGRPLWIADEEIDQTLPLDVDCESTLVGLVGRHEADTGVPQPKRNVAPGSTTNDEHPVSSMTSAIHIIRLRQLESKIQRELFALNSSLRLRPAVVQKLLEDIESWKLGRPRPTVDSALPCCPDEWFLIRAEYVCATSFDLSSSFSGAFVGPPGYNGRQHPRKREFAAVCSLCSRIMRSLPTDAPTLSDF
jgi:hypothetical protein